MERRLFDLQDACYTFTTDSTDLRALQEYLPGVGDITGAVVEIRAGDYAEIWITDSARPYELGSAYTRVYKEKRTDA
jgi:hypothetical protein